MRSLLILTALAAGSVVPAFLQDTSRSSTQGTSTQGTTGRDMRTDKDSRLDGFLANWLLIDNRNEVAIAEIAQQKAQDPEVKRFAQKMIEDHRQFADKLQSFAGTMGYSGRNETPGSTSSRGGTDGNRGGTDSNSDDSQGSTTGSQGSRGSSTTGPEYGFDGSKHMIFEELGQQCLDSAKKELNQHSGADFDRCFMGMMVGEHMKANDMLTVFQRHASGSLKNVLSEGQSTVSTHLDQAKEIKRKLEGSVGARNG